MCPQRFRKVPFSSVHAYKRKKRSQKFQLWRAFSKSSVLIDLFHRIHVDVSHIRKAKVAFSNKNGFVWTGLSSPFLPWNRARSGYEIITYQHRIPLTVWQCSLFLQISHNEAFSNLPHPPHRDLGIKQASSSAPSRIANSEPKQRRFWATIYNGSVLFRSMAVVLPTFSSTSTRVKEDSNANLAASRHIKRENSLFPVDLHH